MNDFHPVRDGLINLGLFVLFCILTKLGWGEDPTPLPSNAELTQEDQSQ